MRDSREESVSCLGSRSLVAMVQIPDLGNRYNELTGYPLSGGSRRAISRLRFANTRGHGRQRMVTEGAKAVGVQRVRL